MLIGLLASEPLWAGEIPDTVARLVNFKAGQATDSPIELECQNTGKEPITAIVIRNISDKQQSLLMQDFPQTPLVPGQTRALPLTSFSAATSADFEIAAVIFANGTHIGDPPNPAYYNKSAVEELFEFRTAMAAEEAKWAGILGSSSKDDHAAIQQFLDAVAALPAEDQTATTQAELARNYMYMNVRYQASQVRQTLQDHTHDEGWIHQHLDEKGREMTAHAQVLRQYARNVGKVAAQ
ncbi:MAG: hypothetical protein M3Y72_24850 [Acidobacteriota bacterium]|nr:hypothetical protein [Acidobacteriota bacterium]